MEHKISVLVVEDTEDWRDIFTELLTSRDYLVETASSYLAAKQILLRKSFDMAVVDIRLSEGDTSNTDGMRVLENIRNSKDPTNIVIVSGYATVELARSALVEFKALDLIEKDRFDEDEFVKVVERGTQGARAFGYGNISFLETFFAERGFPIEEALSLSGSMQDMEELLKGMFAEIWPFSLHPQSKSKLLHVGFGESLAQIIGWSKRKGEAVVLRIGPKSIITRESRSYTANKLEPVLNLRRDEPHYKSNLGGLVYFLKDAQPETLRDFASFYLEEDTSVVSQAIHNLFWRTCSKLYLEKGVEKEKVNLSTAYKPLVYKLMDEKAQEKRTERRYLEQLEADDLRSYLDGQNRMSQEETELIEYISAKNLIFENCPICVVHGDLRDGNVILDSSGSQAWLLGFYDTESSDVLLNENEGPDSKALRAYQIGKRNMFHDFATLEVSIHNMLGVVPAKDLIAFDTALCEPRAFGDLPRSGVVFTTPELLKAYRVIIKIRELICEIVTDFEGDMRLYYTELLFQCLQTYLRETDQLIKQQMWASAVVFTKRLNSWH